jgi:putative hydrolase of the HAD superfamily
VPHVGSATVISVAGQRAVFFDLYGTLIDIRTDEDDPRVYATLSDFLAYSRVVIAPEDLVREYRDRVRAHLARSGEPFPEVDVCAVFGEIVSEYRRPPSDGGPDPADAARLFRALTRRRFVPFPGVHEVLARLRDKYRLGLISDAQWVFTDPELEMAQLDRFFSTIVLSSRIGVKKPDARPFAAAMRALEAAPEASVYVGDNPGRDLVGARNAGMRCVLFRGRDLAYDTLTPDAYFGSYDELEPILTGLLGG